MNISQKTSQDPSEIVRELRENAAVRECSCENPIGTCVSCVQRRAAAWIKEAEEAMSELCLLAEEHGVTADSDTVHGLILARARALLSRLSGGV